jgi:hypothetical protein
MEAAMKFEFVDQSQDRKTDRPDDSTNRAGAADKVIRLGVNGSGKATNNFAFCKRQRLRMLPPAKIRFIAPMYARLPNKLPEGNA